MRTKNMTIAAVAGGAVALVAGILCLTGGRTATASQGRTAGSGAVSQAQARSAQPKTRATYAAPAAGRRGGRAAAPVPGAPADPVAEKARDLLARLQAAVGPNIEYPADLQRDLMDFLAGGEANRSAIFALAWDPSTSRMVLGHLRVFLSLVKDEGTRNEWLAAFDGFDPHAAERAAVAARTKDPALFVASLRAAATGAEKVAVLRQMPQASWSEPTISAWLLEAAREDADEDVRGHAYMILAVAKNTDALPVITAAAGDPGRSVTERKRAAFALSQLPADRNLDELLRLYDGAPDEVRRNLLPAIAGTPADRRVDDLLLEVLASAETTEKTRKAAGSAIQSRLLVLSASGARDLGARTAEVLKGLDSEKTVLALDSLGGAVCMNEPLRDAVKDLERTAPAGGAIQVALVNTPALRFALGRN